MGQIWSAAFGRRDLHGEFCSIVVRRARCDGADCWIAITQCVGGGIRDSG